MKRQIIYVVVLVIFVAGHATAGSIGFIQIRRYMDWDPDCYKPQEPYFYVSSISDYNDAIGQYNSYLQEVETYVGCLQNEGVSDLEIISEVISDSVADKRSEILRELENVKSNLLLQKPYN